MRTVAILQKLETINLWVGRSVAWLTLAMVLVTFAIVVLRYLFDLGWIWLQESVTWMHACVFMLGAAYTLARDEHVRVDVLYRRAGPGGRAWVNVIGCLVFLGPFSLFLLFGSWDYVATAWRIGETSREAGGLPFPAVPLMKSMIPLTASLLLLQALVMLAQNALLLRHGDLPAAAPPPQTKL